MITRRTRCLSLLICMILAATLWGCGKEEPAETVPVTENCWIDIGGSTIDNRVTELNLNNTAYSLDTLLEVSGQLTNVSKIDFADAAFTPEQLRRIQEAFPAAELCCNINLFGQILTQDTTYLDLQDMAVAGTAELVSVLPYLPKLEEINFVNSEGICVYGIEDIPLLDQVRACVPEVSLHVSFELFGQHVTSEDERIEYYLVPIGNEGVETVRAVLPYLTSCTYLLMDGCEVDNEVMAQLRADFPQTKVVWRVWVTTPNYDSPKQLRWAGFLTDTHRIRTILINDQNCDVLKYCVETKYVDFGHNYEISDFSFLAYMPKLEAAIIGLTKCNDISALANCPELEYLEVYGSDVTDLSPLAACTKLKHLNISRMQVDDITCLYGLELERFRAVATNVPKEQIDEYAALHPDCQMLMDGWAPHENGWRYDNNRVMVPRYKLLREQMEYAEDRKYGIQ